MQMVIQGLIGLMGLMLFGLGMKSMFAPKSMVKNFAVEPVGASGLNTSRGMIGGFFLASVVMLFSRPYTELGSYGVCSALEPKVVQATSQIHHLISQPATP